MLVNLTIYKVVHHQLLEFKQVIQIQNLAGSVCRGSTRYWIPHSRLVCIEGYQS